MGSVQSNGAYRVGVFSVPESSVSQWHQILLLQDGRRLCANGPQQVVLVQLCAAGGREQMSLRLRSESSVSQGHQNLLLQDGRHCCANGSQRAVLVPCALQEVGCSLV